MAGTTTLMDPIRVAGLREFQASCKAYDGESQKLLRVVLNTAVELVVNEARPRVPTKTGAARASIKPQSSQREARVRAGGSKAPYYPWLDYGGRVGRGRTGPGTGSVNRPFERGGRYLYPAYSDVRPKVLDAMTQGLADLGRSIGLEVT